MCFPPFCSTHMLLIFVFSCISRCQRLLTGKILFPELSVCFINAAKMPRREEVGMEGTKGRALFWSHSYQRVTVLFPVAFASCHGIPLSLYPGGVFLI